MVQDICFMNILRTITNSVWAIEPNVLSSLLPSIKMLVNGHQLMLSEFASKDKPVIENSIGSGNTSTDFVFILPIKGVMTKYSNCGEMCMLDMNELISAYAQDPNCIGMVMDIDSGGGQASYLPYLSQTIRDFKATGKPIIAYYNGLCCSAAYYVASQATEIYASTAMDIVGSIGTVLSTSINNEANSDYREVMIYANASTRKHGWYRDLLSGVDANEIAKSELDPLNDLFLQAVQSGRDGKVSAEALTGETFTTQKAIELGLIDGEMRLIKDAVARVFTLSIESKNTNNNQNNMQMKKFEKISKIVGRDVFSMSDLTEEDVQMIEDHNDSPAQTTAEQTNVQPVVNSEEVATAVMGSLAPTLQKLEERLQKLESPGATATVANVVNTNQVDDKPVHAWEDPSNSINQAFQKQLENL